MELANLCEDDEIQKIVCRWNRLSKSDRRYISLDSLIEGTEVTSNQLLSAVSVSAYCNDYYEVGCKLMFISQEHLRVLEDSIKRATTKEGFKDRWKLARHYGLIP